MTRLVLIVLLCLGGCALGRVKADGTLEGIAFGNSKIEVACYTVKEAIQNEDTAALRDGTKCGKIEGGNLSTGVIGLLESVATGIIAYFSAGAL